MSAYTDGTLSKLTAKASKHKKKARNIKGKAKAEVGIRPYSDKLGKHGPRTKPGRVSFDYYFDPNTAHKGGLRA